MFALLKCGIGDRFFSYGLDWSAIQRFKINKLRDYAAEDHPYDKDFDKVF